MSGTSTFNLLLRQWKKLPSVAFFILITKLSSVSVPLILGLLIDRFSETPDLRDNSTLAWLLAAFCLAGVIQVTVLPLQALFLSRLIQGVLLLASKSWIRSLMGKDFDLFSTVRVGALLSAVDRGVAANERMLTYLLQTAVPVIVEALVVGGLLLVVGGWGMFAFVFSSALLYLLASHGIITWRRAHIESVNHSEDKVAESFASLFISAPVIKVEGTPASAFKAMDSALGGYAAAAATVGYSASILAALKALFVCVTTAGILLVGLFQPFSIGASMTAGQLVALFSVTTSFIGSIAALSEAYRFTDQFRADQKRFKEVLGLPSSIPINPAVEQTLPERVDLALRALQVRNDAGARLDLPQGFHLRCAEQVAVIGTSGSGKSTLLDALAGTCSQSLHALRIGGRGVSEWGSIRQFELIRYCPQRPALLAGRLQDAVFYGQSYDEDFTPFLRYLGLESLSRTSDDFEFSEQGGNVSGGEARRLSLLRVIMRPGLFNLFDEPTAALDGISAARVWDLLFERFQGRALLCVTHDLQRIQHFDRVVVMDGGRILAEGRWQDLADQPKVREIVQAMRGETTAH